jgi:hypothetical protein
MSNLKTWGPHLWEFLHIYTATYPINADLQTISKARYFFESIANNLPCEICSKEFLIIITKGVKNKISILDHKILSGRDSFFKWLYDVHDYVNKNKKISSGEYRTISPSFDNIKKKYKDYLKIGYIK